MGPKRDFGGLEVFEKWWPGTESVLPMPLMTRKLLNPNSASTARKAAMPGRRYKKGTKAHRPASRLYSSIKLCLLELLQCPFPNRYRKLRNFQFADHPLRTADRGLRV